MQNEVILLQQLKSNKSKEHAFKELVTLYKERLYWHIRHIVKSHDDADDVLQNTFIKVFKNINSFKGDSKIYSWMYRIATNEAITHINKNAKRLQISNEETQELALNNLTADVYFEGDFSFVLMDIKLPGLSGVETLNIILEQSPKTRILLMTGCERGSAEVASANMAGAIGVLYKPFRINDLLTLINK